MPTFSIVRVRPGDRHAPTMKKVADEMSPGTVSDVPVSRWPPSSEQVSPSLRTSTPKPRSIRSV